MAKYWVGGTGNTNDPTNHWATTSGGAPGAGNAPTAADDIIFDANSGVGTVTINAALVGRSIQTAGSSIATIVHNAATTVTLGDATAPAGGVALDLSGLTTYTLGNAITSQIAFVSTNASTHDINCKGFSVGDFTINTSANPTYRLTAGMLQGATTRITWQQGNLNFNGQTVSLGLFVANLTNTRTLTLGAATITVLGTGGNAWNVTTSSNLTVSAASSTINFTGASPTFATGNKTYGTVTFNSSASGNKVITSAGAVIGTLTITGPAGTSDNYSLSGAITVSGTFTFNGNSVVNRGILFSSVFGTSRTITAGTTVLSNVDFRDITGAGAAAWTGTSIGDAGGNSGITTSTPKTVYWVGTTASWNVANRWAATSGGATSAANYPLPQDTAVFDAASLSATTTVTIGNAGVQRHAAIDTSAIDQLLTFTVTQVLATQGDVVLAAGVTVNGVGGIQFNNRDAKTFDPNGATMTAPLRINALGGSVDLLDDLSLTGANGAFTLFAGTFDDNDNDVFIEVTALDSGALTKSLITGSGTWTFGNTGTGTIWSMGQGTNTTLTVNSTNIAITASSAAQTFGLQSKTYGNMTISSGSGLLTFGGSGTVANLSIAAPKSVRFTVGGGQSLTVTGTIGSTGSPGSLVTIDTTAPGTAHSLIKTSGTVNVGYWSIKDSAASGGATFLATAGSVNVSGNSGWIFYSDSMLLMF